MTTGLELRYFPVSEMRASEQDSKTVIGGYAAVFNTLSQVMYWGFREQIAPGAFANSLDYDIRALWNHDTNFLLGRTKNGTLRVSEDDKGLAVEIEPPTSTIVESFIESIRRGDVDQMSFGFTTLDDTWDIQADGTYVRTLLKVRLYEVSPVTFPAYSETSIGVRNAENTLYVPSKPMINRGREERVRRLWLLRPR